MSEESITFVVAVWGILSWLTHVFTCIKTSSWAFMVVGALIFPVANIHGTGVWFGWW